MCKEKQNQLEKNASFSANVKKNEVRWCIYWSPKKSDTEGRYYCTWDGEYHWMKECLACESFRRKSEGDMQEVGIYIGKES